MLSPLWVIQNNQPVALFGCGQTPSVRGSSRKASDLRPGIWDCSHDRLRGSGLVQVWLGLYRVGFGGHIPAPVGDTRSSGGYHLHHSTRGRETVDARKGIDPPAAPSSLNLPGGSLRYAGGEETHGGQDAPPSGGRP